MGREEIEMYGASLEGCVGGGATSRWVVDGGCGRW